MSLKVRDMNDLLHKSIKVRERGSSTSSGGGGGGRVKREVKREHGRDDDDGRHGGVGGAGDVYDASGDSPEYLPNEEDFEQMANLGLPTEFSQGGAVIKEEVTRKGEKKQVYYCEVCEIELNSKDTMTSHVKGVKHTKKTLLEEEKKQKAAIDGTYIPAKVIRQLQAAKPVPKKIPVRLSEKLREDTDPIVGLSFIEEVLACSRVEMEPHYECLLCRNTGGSNGMRAHIFGRPHREKFLQYLHPDDARYLEPPKSLLMRDITRLKENEKLHTIRTIYSDELYPWPAGKAPWSVEQGGSGVAPKETGLDVARKLRREAIIRGVSVEEVFATGTAAAATAAAVDRKGGIVAASGYSGVLPSASDLEEVRGESKMRECYSLALALVEKASEYHSGHCPRTQQREKVESLVSMLQSNVVALMNSEVEQGDDDEIVEDRTTTARRPTEASYPSSSYAAVKSEHYLVEAGSSRGYDYDYHNSPSTSSRHYSSGRPSSSSRRADDGYSSYSGGGGGGSGRHRSRSPPSSSSSPPYPSRQYHHSRERGSYDSHRRHYSSYTKREPDSPEDSRRYGSGSRRY